MDSLIISRKIRVPMFSIWKWKIEDFKIPLRFQFSDCNAFISIEPSNIDGKRFRDIIWDVVFQLEFSNPSQQLLKAVTTSGEQAFKLAEKIYGCYKQVIYQFEGILRVVCKVKNLISETPFEFESFFEDRGWLEPGVKWSYGKESGIFKPKISIGRHRINPLFKRDQVIDAIKWKRIQKAINNKELPSEEMMALLRIRSRLEWREKKVATIEASIIAEAILRNYGDRILTTLGFSGNKLKNLKDELTFSTLLNIVLPLTLSKSRSAKLQDKIDAVNVLRKIRNDLVHGIISESEIDDKNVRAGIESTLKLVEFIREKLGHK